MAGEEMSDLSSSKPLTIGNLEIEVIERVVVRVENVCGGIVGIALKEPIAVVVGSPAGTWRVDLESLDR
jgi:hypothetical protein